MASRAGVLDEGNDGIVTPMPRVREIDEPGDDPILRDVYDKERKHFGFILNTTKIQAHCPGIMKFNVALGIEAQGSCVLT